MEGQRVLGSNPVSDASDRGDLQQIFSELQFCHHEMGIILSTSLECCAW